LPFSALTRFRLILALENAVTQPPYEYSRPDTSRDFVMQDEQV